MEFVVKADIDNWDDISDNIITLLRSYGLRNSEIISFLVAMEEIYVNIASYAYPACVGTICVKITVEGKIVSAEFRDNGMPFDPLTVAEPDTRADSKDRTPGGLGIYIARTKTDKILYNYENNENQLTLIKRFS